MDTNLLHYNLDSEVYVNSGAHWVTGIICGYDTSSNSYTIFCNVTGITLVDISEDAVFPLFKYLRNIVNNNNVPSTKSVFTPVASYATQTETQREKERTPRYAELVVTLQHELLRLRQKVEAISPPATPAQLKEVVVTNYDVDINDNASLYSLPSNLSEIFDSQSVDMMSSTNKSEGSELGNVDMMSSTNKSEGSELGNSELSETCHLRLLCEEPLNGTIYVPTKGIRNGKRKSRRLESGKKQAV
jgi:hypothetical protein